ncbi:membrane protein [Legionella antarctica]|uniref:Membrane protein n=1 Tax=Legionella antarctica TaxID=2708020 RepID=A0A6F8TA63_9GAMM|nr:membrane protein [Legionella antarctica]
MLILLGSFPVYAAKIVELSIKGPIGPATADYMDRGITNAQNADLILVILDTPGGLDEAMRIIIQKFLISKVPVVTYVSPNGARAASAGTYLLYASTLAAMAPGTQLGAASPVSIGGGFKSNEAPTTMEKKVRSDAVATIRSLAQLRGRDPIFAQKAVTDAISITASEALKSGVINYIATDVADLLSQLNNVTVMQNNQKITLNTLNAAIEVVEPDWRTRFLSTITNPTVAYLLLLLGIYGIFFELMNPGVVFPGVVGAVAMIIALYALQLLPINYAGLGLIILGLAFIVAEGFTPSFGALGLGGTVAFILGSILLINTTNEAYQIAWSAIWAMAVANVVFLILLMGMVLKSRNQNVRNGLNMLVGATGRALGDINLQGQAVIRGEIWSVSARTSIAADKNIKVISTSGLVLEVEEEGLGK